jgi:hypothetical protein
VEQALQGPAQPSPALRDAINAGFGYLEVKCLGCNAHQTVALDIVRPPKATPIHELEHSMRCKDCSRLQGGPYKRSHLALLGCFNPDQSRPVRLIAQTISYIFRKFFRCCRTYCFTGLCF